MNLTYFQVIHVEDETALDLVSRYGEACDAFLLDSGKPSAGRLGGTGAVHDWRISAEFVRRSPVPVYLAGGLNPDNVARAIAEVRPGGVDICSGVRRGGRDYPEFCAWSLVGSCATEALSEQNGELGLRLGPLARRSFPTASDVIQN